MEKIYLFRISFVFLVALEQHNVQMSSIDTDISSWKECLPSSKIVGGKPINISKAPFILSLEMIKYCCPPYYVSFCGASILSRNIALTAAHCTVDIPPGVFIILRSGTSTAGIGGYIHNIIKVVNHELWTSVKKEHDIALLFVMESFMFSPIVQPIKLPTKELPAGTLAKVAGYGHTNPRPPNNYNTKTIGVLKRASIPIINIKICKEVMKEKIEIMNELNGLAINITEMMFCGGYPGGKIDACQGDSGGPLYRKKTVYGVVSWGAGCAAECSPGIYTNIYKHLYWINQKIAENKEN